MTISMRYMIATLGVLAILAASLVLPALFKSQGGMGSIPEASAASADYFLKIDGIEGESKDDKHKGEIEINSWSWGMTQTGSFGSGGGGGTGKVQMQDFHFTMSVNKATPKLMLACATGEHIKEVKLTARKMGTRIDNYEIKLSDVVCSSFKDAGDQSNGPIESISFSYGKIEMVYIPVEKGNTLGEAIRAGWDIAKNKKI